MAVDARLYLAEDEDRIAPCCYFIYSTIDRVYEYSGHRYRQADVVGAYSCDAGLVGPVHGLPGKLTKH